ncbi:MAG: hypothetical protein SNJ74_08620 [Fimbriimonadaceae bacterium]
MSEPPVIPPTAADPDREATDADQLNRLGIFWTVHGCAVVFLSLLTWIYIAMGVLMLANPASFASEGGAAPPAFFARALIGLGAAAFLVLATFAVLSFMTARRIRLRFGLTFVQVAAGLNCLVPPTGLPLGILTLIVTSRASVRRLFDAEGYSE